MRGNVSTSLLSGALIAWRAGKWGTEDFSRSQWTTNFISPSKQALQTYESVQLEKVERLPTLENGVVWHFSYFLNSQHGTLLAFVPILMSLKNVETDNVPDAWG